MGWFQVVEFGDGGQVIMLRETYIGLIIVQFGHTDQKGM